MNQAAMDTDPARHFHAPDIDPRHHRGDSRLGRESRGYESQVRRMQPLILVGMHRSGTSLMVRLLADVGVHMGTWLSRDAEAVHFQKLNRRIYAAAGAKWATVDGLLQEMASEDFVARQTELTRRRLFDRGPFPRQGSLVSGFFGKQLWGRIQRGDAFSWGWKDPRTSLTLPIWLRIFPQARCVHVLRNGIDVAISIHRRSKKQRRKVRNRLFPLDYSPVTLDFAYGFRLWETYVCRILEYRDLLPAGRYMEVRYEELLEAPEEQLRRLVVFLEHRASDDELSAACRGVDKSRLDNSRYAMDYQAEIQALRASSLMKRLGYGYQDVPVCAARGDGDL